MGAQLLRWVLLVTLAEAVGFTVPTAVGIVVTGASWGPVATLIALMLAGSVEGAVLGTAQADCLYRWGVLPVRRWWIVATGLGAAVAWSIGMSLFTLGGPSWTAAAVVVVGIGGLLLLTSLPLAQYVVLRDHVKRPVLWIPINMAAWLLGIAWTLAPSPWVDESTPTTALILIYGIAGLCMAATVAIVTGVGIVRLMVNSTADAPRAISTRSPFRWTIVAVESMLSLGGLAGSIQLLAGAATPPVSVLSPFGLSSWTLPAGWLFLSVALPSGLAAWLAWRRSLWAPPAVLLASALLATELLVQIPFLGFSVLQLIFGVVAVGMAVVGLLAGRAGWWPHRRPAAEAPAFEGRAARREA
jgi:hypothetical protein